MNWFKKASFADSVGCSAWGDSYATVVVNGKRYEYSGIDGHGICNRIQKLRMSRNKSMAGSEISKMLRSMESKRVINEDEESVDSLMRRSVEDA